MKVAILIILVHQYILQSAGKKIVFFPFFQLSHISSFVKVAEALTDLHHETWVCVPQFIYDKKILNVDKFQIVPYGHELEDLDSDFFKNTGMLENFWDGSVGFVQFLYKMHAYMYETSFKIFTDPSFISALEDINPDYFILDSMPLLSNSLALPYKFKVPFSVLGVAYDIIGARVPFSPAAVPSMLFQESFTNETTFLHRLTKTFGYFLLLVTDPSWDPRIAEALVPGETPPSSSRSLIKKADLHLVENDVILGYSYPQLSNTIMIGGTSAVPAKKLPQKFEQIITRAQNGIVLVSFGSSVASFPPDITAKLLAALSDLPYHVVWRVNMASPDERKITTSTWIPQNDLLGHNNGTTTRVFVSHCGAWGQYEALYHGVPILCLPIFSDQPFNAYRIRDKLFGTFSDIRTISAKELSSLILQVALNETYRNTIREASGLFKELYKSPTKTAAYWIDHVMKHGSKHLRAAGQDMPAYQLLLLDVVAFVVFCLLILSFLVFYLIKCCLSRCCSKHRTVKKVKTK